MRIAIVGAGMAGLACGEALRAAAHDVILFDKGSRPGGRMSTRTLETPVGAAAFDYGAQYFSARDPLFRSRVAQWLRDGVVARWSGAGDDAWVGVPGMSAPIIAMAAQADVRWSARVETLTRNSGTWHLHAAEIDAPGFDATIIAVPAEQVSALVGTFDPRMAAAAASMPSDPCWTVMAAFAEALPIEADVLRSNSVIGWAARNSAKPGRVGPEAWVIQASPGWSRAHLEDHRHDVIRALLETFAETTGLAMPKPAATAAHRWRYARTGRNDVFCLWNSELKLGLCGDWLIGPRVESAWMSGTSLAAAVGPPL